MPIQTAADSISNSAGSPYGFKNRIINGAMVIDQRNAGASTTGTTSVVYSVDRFASYVSTDGTMTFQQSSTAPAGFNNSVVATTTSADASLSAGQRAIFLQRIEGYNIADFGWGTANAKTVTLSFWVRSSLTGTFGGALTDTTRAYPFTYTISSANTWEQKSITILGDTSGSWNSTNGWGVQIAFGLGVGSTFSGTAGAWVNGDLNSATGAVSVIGTLNATWYVTGVQLEKGSQATSFDWRPYTTELQLCQRYFEKTYLQSEVPGANYDARDSASRSYSFGDSSAQSQPFVWNFKVSKRSAPTVNIYNPYNGTANQYRVLESGANMSAQVIKNLSAETCTVASAGSGLSSNYRFDVHLTANSEL
jgi:hypothetical protein